MPFDRVPLDNAGSWSVCPERISVVIPTLNAGTYLPSLLPALATQGIPADRFLIIDSQSTDETRDAFQAFGATVVVIERRTFNHGGTRQRAVEMCSDADFIVMMTQDAIPRSDHAIARLMDAFTDPMVGIAYGRQLPRTMARGIERHARLTNYPPTSQTRDFADRFHAGIKTVFCSDSFAAYRAVALNQVGGFPEDAFFAEDQLVAGRMLINGWRIAYCGDAEVTHSHGYTIAQEFRRYFDVGVFHGRNRWLVDAFGRAEGEGFRFVKSEMLFLMKNDRNQMLSAIIRTLAKYFGYVAGNHEDRIPLAFKKMISMQPFYWK